MGQGTNPNIVKTMKRISREWFDVPNTKRIEDKRTKQKYKPDWQYESEEDDWDDEA